MIDELKQNCHTPFMLPLAVFNATNNYTFRATFFLTHHEYHKLTNTQGFRSGSLKQNSCNTIFNKFKGRKNENF